ncbi:MAG TPA: transglycosylase domain-containing protein [Kofleriaceae bacterium]|nr:transglycosylase domain-containing protein [Kofleriaceae bacterium]
MRRRWLLIGGVTLGLGICVVLFLFVIYGRVGAWVVRSKVVPRLEKKLGRTVEIGDIDVRRGHATLLDVVVKGPNDQGAPLVRVDRIEAEIGFMASLTGDVELGLVRVEGVKVSAVRTRTGDNFTDILDRLRGKGPEGEASGGGGMGKLRPERLEMVQGHVEVRDTASGVTVVSTAIAAEGDSTGALKVSLGDVALLTELGPYANAEGVEVTADLDDPVATAAVKVGGGEMFLWSGMTLTGLTGTVAQGEKLGRLEIAFSGGYGGVQGTLWQANGWVEPAARAARVKVKADRFTFDRIAPVLRDSMVRDFDKTSVDAELEVDVTPAQVAFKGGVNLVGLNVFHPGLSDQTVEDVNLRGDLDAGYDRTAKVMKLHAAMETRGVGYQLDGTLELPYGVDPDGTQRKFRRFDARLTIPPVPCKAVLASIPTAIAPKLVGFQMSGTFKTDVFVDVDWADLEATKLEGSVGIRGCKVVKAPKEMDAKRLTESFKHEVEVLPEKFETIVIGPENPNFVPITEVSQYLIKSLMTTEDSSFYKHHGFITREFRTALVKNLEAGYFKYGASSITMQLVKNVLLHREKTLARKFQELFLTWYIESKLEKDRLLEIYVNAIEYGPGLYGIKPASFQYFGKPPAELNPVEAAFFSSILPAPKRRFTQFCKDELTGWTVKKIQRILELMEKRGRLTPEELSQALVTPLVFQPNKRGFCDKKIPEWDIKPVRIR